MEAGKRRLAGDTARAATTGEVRDLRREARALKECVPDLTLENHLLKESIIAESIGCLPNVPDIKRHIGKPFLPLFDCDRVPL